MNTDIDDPDVPLVEIFHAYPATARIFWARGMACVGCPIAPFHSVHDACFEYHLDETAFRMALRILAVDGPTSPPRRSAPRAGARRSR